MKKRLRKKLHVGEYADMYFTMTGKITGVEEGKADDFYAKDVCIGCGKCAKLCPLNNIAIVDKKPVWGDHCTHCMACIGNCPVEAITGELKQKHVIDPSKCIKCGQCIDNCPKKAIVKG